MADKPDDDVYEIPALEADIPTEWRANAAKYDLEQPARCPYCREVLRSLRVLKMTRSQVAFTSTLPRSGKVIVCPECDRILSAEVSGLL